MKKRNKILLMICLILLFILLVFNTIIFYQYNHVHYKYYWNRLLNKTQTFSLYQKFTLETGVLAKLENSEYSFIFKDNFQKDMQESGILSCIDCTGDYYDIFYNYFSGHKIEDSYNKSQQPYRTVIYDQLEKNQNGFREFMFSDNVYIK